MIESLAGSRQPSFRRSLLIQLRVVGALVRRLVLTRHGRHNIGFLWVIAEPMMFTGGVVTLWSVFHGGGSHADTPIIPFLVTGYPTVLLWRNTAGRAGDSVRGNASLLYHRNVRVLDISIANLLVETGGASISFVTLTVFFMFIGAMNLPYDVIDMISAWLLLTWFAMGLGMIIGALCVYSEIYAKLWHIAAYLFLPMSGAFSMVDWWPKRFQQILMLVPPVDCVEFLRHGYFGPELRTHYDLLYVVVFNMIMTMVGLQLIKVSERRLEEGSL